MVSPGGRRSARSFNRFYTEAIGSLDEAHEGTPLTLTQSRMLYTTRLLENPDVGHLAEKLNLDFAYTSRVLGDLEDAGLITRTVSTSDRRRRRVALTRAGTRMLTQIEARSNQRMFRLVEHLDGDQIHELLDAFRAVRRLLEGEKNR